MRFDYFIGQHHEQTSTEYGHVWEHEYTLKSSKWNQMNIYVFPMELKTYDKLPSYSRASQDSPSDRTEPLHSMSCLRKTILSQFDWKFRAFSKYPFDSIKAHIRTKKTWIKI